MTNSLSWATSPHWTQRRSELASVFLKPFQSPISSVAGNHLGSVGSFEHRRAPRPGVVQPAAEVFRRDGSALTNGDEGGRHPSDCRTGRGVHSAPRSGNNGGSGGGRIAAEAGRCGELSRSERIERGTATPAPGTRRGRGGGMICSASGSHPRWRAGPVGGLIFELTRRGRDRPAACVHHRWAVTSSSDSLRRIGRRDRARSLREAVALPSAGGRPGHESFFALRAGRYASGGPGQIATSRAGPGSTLVGNRHHLEGRGVQRSNARSRAG